MWCRDGEDRWHVAVPRVEMTEPAELGAHWVEFGLERRAAQRAPGPGWPRDCLCLAGPGGSLMPVLTCTVATTLSTSCPGWKAPSQLQVSRVEPEAGPSPGPGPLSISVVNFWPPLLAFGPEPCRPHFPSHLSLCVSLPCVAGKGVGLVLKYGYFLKSLLYYASCCCFYFLFIALPGK